MLWAAALSLVLLLSGCSGTAGRRMPTATPTPIELLQLPAINTPTPIVIVAPPTVPPTPVPSATPTPSPEEGVVLEVVSGDTLRVLIDGVEKFVRLLGVESPRMNTPLGQLAAEATQSIAEGQPVRLARDVTPTDSRGSLLRYVYRMNDDLFVNAEVVRQGWARAVADPLNVAQSAALSAAEAQAASAAVGIWVAESGPATNQPATLYGGAGLEFPVVANLPANTALLIDAASPDGQWFRVAGTQWIPGFFVINAPLVTSLPLAAVPSPTPDWSPTPIPTPREPTLTPTPVPTFAIGAIKIVQVDRINEYFVLRNDTTGAIALTDWKLKSENGGEICFLSGVIGPGGLVRFWSKVDAPPPDFSCNFAWETWADLEDETALLFDPSGLIVDRQLYPIYTPPPAVPPDA